VPTQDALSGVCKASRFKPGEVGKNIVERARRDVSIIEDLLARLDAIGDVELSDKDREDYAVIDLDLLVSVFPLSENDVLKK
jgi:hypothetical protein